MDNVPTPEELRALLTGNPWAVNLGTYYRIPAHRPALHVYRLDFTIGPATYSQDIHAEDLGTAARIARETVVHIESFEGPADSLSLAEIEII